MARRRPKRTGRTPDWLLTAGAVLAVCVVAYAPTLGYPYVQDAVLAVRDNPVIDRGDPLEILTSRYWKDAPLPPDTLYRPATVASFALERAVAGRPAPGLSHAVNLLLHAAVALLVGRYGMRLGLSRGASRGASVLFAAHPLALQSVANVVGRAELIAAAGSLAALDALTRTGGWPGSPEPSAGLRRLASWGGAAALLVALGGKEIAVATPLLLLAQEAYFRGARRAVGGKAVVSRITALAPCGIAIVVWLSMRTLALEAFPAAQDPQMMNNPLVSLHGAPRWAGALAMSAEYLRRIIWPAGLAADHSGAALGLGEPVPVLRALVGAGFLLTLLALTLRPLLPRCRGGSRAVAMGAALFLLPYLVVGNLLVPNGAGFAERLVYFPLTGLVLVAGAGGQKIAERLRDRRGPSTAKASSVLVVALAVAGVAATRAQVGQWSDEQALWNRVLAQQPRSLRGNFTMAELRARQGRLQEAIRYYDRARASDPSHAPSWLYRGQALARSGDLVAATASLRQAVRLDPSSFEAHFNLGGVLARTGRIDEARRELDKALAIRPRLLPAMVERAHLELRYGDPAEAVERYRRCIERGRDDLRPLLERAEAMAAAARGRIGP